MIKLLGIPFDLNSSFLRGPAQAPAHIRKVWKSGASNNFSEEGIDMEPLLHDEGDLSFDAGESMSSFLSIATAIENLITGENKILSLGGDHSITFPIVQGFAKKYPKLHILHIDAHADLYDEYDGNKFSHACPFARIMENQLATSLTQVGIRTLNTHQREQAKKFGVTIATIGEEYSGLISKLKAPLYVSLDLDALDPAYVPGISHYEPGGLTTREVIRIIQSIRVPIAGADLVEYNPLRDVHDVTAMVAFKLMKEMVAKMID